MDALSLSHLRDRRNETTSPKPRRALGFLDLCLPCTTIRTVLGISKRSFRNHDNLQHTSGIPPRRAVDTCMQDIFSLALRRCPGLPQDLPFTPSCPVSRKTPLRIIKWSSPAQPAQPAHLLQSSAEQRGDRGGGIVLLLLLFPRLCFGWSCPASRRSTGRVHPRLVETSWLAGSLSRSSRCSCL